MTIEKEIGRPSETGRLPPLMLTNGRILYVVDRERMAPGEVQEVRTPTAIARIHRTVLMIQVSRRVTEICVVRGAAVASTLRGVEVKLDKGQCVKVGDDYLGPREQLDIARVPDDADSGD